jgi:uncharacterized protein YkwD
MRRRGRGVWAALVAAAIVGATIVAGQASSAPTRGDAPRAASAAADFASDLLALINAFRAQNGLPPFVLAPPFVLLATQHSQDMLEQGYFDHDSPDGTTFDERVGGFLKDEGYKSWAAAENIDTGSGEPDAQLVFQDWLESPDHRKNMLAKDTKQIGIGVATAPSAPGYYDGTPDPYTVTAIFGPPQPVLRVSVLVTTVKGVVLVRHAGEKTFKPLRTTELIKVGSEVETSAGRVRLTSAADDQGVVQTGDFYQGRFGVGYTDDFPTVTPPQVVTNLRLTGPLKGCGARKRALALASGNPTKAKKRRLWGSGKGHFRTTGRYASATVRGTTWLTEDSCTTTLVRVRSGIVDVFDVGRRKHVLVRAGKSYTAHRR